MVVFGRDGNVLNLINGGWFLECIMIYYIPLWLIKKYLKSHLTPVFIICSLGFLGYFIWYTRGFNVKLIDNTDLKSVFFFLVMLMGAYTGLHRLSISYKGRKDLMFLLINVAFFFGCTYARRYSTYIQLLSVPSLIGVCYYTYKLCHTALVRRLLSKRISYSAMRFVGSLCLEVYFVNIPIINATAGIFWPLRLIVIAVATMVCAYIIRCLSRWFLQTFSEADYDWRQIIKMY